MKYGTIKWYDAKKGYGFIEPDNENKDVFVHVTQLEKSACAVCSTASASALKPTRTAAGLPPETSRF